jgi:hypothetical protein
LPERQNRGAGEGRRVASALEVPPVIPQNYPLYITEPGNQTWLVIGWVPDQASGLPRQPVVLLCGSETEAPRLLEQTVPFRVVGTGHRPQ